MSTREQILLLIVITVFYFYGKKKGWFEEAKSDEDEPQGIPIRQDLHAHPEPTTHSECQWLCQQHHPWGIKRQQCINKCNERRVQHLGNPNYPDWYWYL